MKKLILGLVLFTAALSLQAQVSPGAGYGGIGDPASAPGDPASSYALSGVDHLNYYNGSVNFTIPVLSIGGRGTVARNIVIPVQQQWSTYETGGTYAPGSSEYPVQAGDYTSGSFSIEATSTNPYACVYNGQWVGTGPFNTYVVWTNFDGTQVVLTDLKYNGQPQNGSGDPCNGTFSGADRGRIFRSTDGTDLTYVSNWDVVDGGTSIVNGTLITRDGTKYTFSPDSYVSQIEDRNGNLVSFAFQSTASGGIFTVTDPANRKPTINFTEDPVHDSQDVITYPGFNGSSHQIKVNYSLLQNSLASGESLETYHCLFPELNGASTSTNYNPYLVSSVVMADGHTYAMQYNSYGEVVRLTLPTGGVYVYKYKEAGCTANGNSGVITLQNNSGYRILRRLLERDEYSDGTNLSAKIVFSSTTGNDDGNHPSRPTTAVTVNFEDG